jgi:hypothetical protein
VKVLHFLNKKFKTQSFPTSSVQLAILRGIHLTTDPCGPLSLSISIFFVALLYLLSFSFSFLLRSSIQADRHCHRRSAILAASQRLVFDFFFFFFFFVVVIITIIAQPLASVRVARYAVDARLLAVRPGG